MRIAKKNRLDYLEEIGVFGLSSTYLEMGIRICIAAPMFLMGQG
jgi:hypothetical protein